MSVLKNKSERLARKIKGQLAHFGRSEDGTIIVMTITWLLLFLIVGGMAVDFMRFESRRAMLQSTADRAVLAAADLSQTLDPKDVVADYFAKSEFPDTIIGEISVDPSGKTRSVGVNAIVEMPTTFLRMLTIYNLDAPASATAIEGIANVEVSLILDISGSMEGTKIVELRKAAKKFVSVLLTDEYKDRVSISLIPYSQQVNAGPLILDQMNVVRNHEFSHCVDFTDAEMSLVPLDLSKSYLHEQHYQWNSSSGNQITEPICPFYDYERIIPVTQDKDELDKEIDKLQPRGGTAIYLGMKWGLSLLDPSMNDAIKEIVKNDPKDGIFADRPEAYAVAGEANATQKVIVLMTDGQNSNSDRLRPEYYKNADDIAHWAEFNMWYSVRNHMGGSYGTDILNFLTYRRFTPESGDTMLKALCDEAKKPVRNIIIYAIAVEAGSHGTTQMANCASSTGHFFDVSSDKMEETFEGIARQITELRLSL